MCVAKRQSHCQTLLSSPASPQLANLLDEVQIGSADSWVPIAKDGCVHLRVVRPKRLRQRRQDHDRITFGNFVVLELFERSLDAGMLACQDHRAQRNSLLQVLVLQADQECSP